MGRPRRQGPRRAQLVAATVTVLERHGLRRVRVRDVAAEAGVSPASVLYYYPDFSCLALTALDVSVRSVASERAAVAASFPDPARRLVALLDLDLADELPGACLAMVEAPLLVGEQPALRAVVESMLAAETETYRSTLEDGIVSGAFVGLTSPDRVASSLVIQLHALRTFRCTGLQTPARSRELVREWLDPMLGVRLPADAPASVSLAGSARSAGVDQTMV